MSTRPIACWDSAGPVTFVGLMPARQLLCFYGSTIKLATRIKQNARPSSNQPERKFRNSCQRKSKRRSLEFGWRARETRKGVKVMERSFQGSHSMDGSHKRRQARFTAVSWRRGVTKVNPNTVGTALRITSRKSKNWINTSRQITTTL